MDTPSGLRWIASMLVVLCCACAPAAGASSGPTCNVRGVRYAIGENFTESCGFCTCGSDSDGGATGGCFGVVCTSGTSVDTRPFERIGTAMCDPEFRPVAYSGTAAEVRHPCGIAGGPVVQNDARCPTLCAGVVPRTARNAGCNRTEDPNMVLCWGR